MISEGGENLEHPPTHHTNPEASKGGGGVSHEPPARSLPHRNDERAIEKTQHALQILPSPEPRNINLSEVDVGSLAEKVDQEQMRILEEWSIHDMPPEVKQWLAEEHQIYTTTEPRDPGSLREFLKQRETERQLERLRDNAIAALNNYPVFKNEKYLGRRLKSIFSEVTDVDITGINYDFDKPSKKYDKPPVAGTARADKIIYTVATKDAAELLHYTFKALLKTTSGQEFPVLIPEEKDGQYIVTICNMTEYTNRVLGNAIDQIVAQEDFDETNTILPKNKTSLKNWKQAGETFHPDVEDRLQEQNNVYQTLGSQRDKNFRTEDVKKDLNLLGSDTAAIFQVVRDAFRPIIHKYRGGDHFNKEQHPDKEKRLWIENGVDLIRPSAKSQKDVKEGPKAASALSGSQHLRAHAETTLRQAMKDKAEAITTGIIKGVSGGVESLIEFGLRRTRSVLRGTEKMNADTEKWEEQKEKVIESRKKIAKLLMELLSEEESTTSVS